MKSEMSRKSGLAVKSLELHSRLLVFRLCPTLSVLKNAEHNVFRSESILKLCVL
jgi:hypothetical protein